MEQPLLQERTKSLAGDSSTTNPMMSMDSPYSQTVPG
jgi:hypothetical protein